MLYETLNIVSKWELPLLIVVENNRYAQSTKIEFTLAGKIKDRFRAFDIETEELDTFNVSTIHQESFKMINKIRNSSKPGCLILNTYRFASHSKSDDGRSQSEIEKWKRKDPLKIAEKALTANIVKNIQLEAGDLITNEINRAIDAPMAE